MISKHLGDMTSFILEQVGLKWEFRLVNEVIDITWKQSNIEICLDGLKRVWQKAKKRKKSVSVQTFQSTLSKQREATS